MSAQTVVICGGGIIGVSVGYYLSQLNTNNQHLNIILVERESIACHASGKAGGFLALDWNDDTPVSSLARLSFKLHQELSQVLPKSINYRKLKTFSIVANAKKGKNITKHEWLDGNIIQSEALGTIRTTAQVDPFQLTNALKDATKGIQVIKDEVIGFDFVNECTLKNVVLQSGKVLKADIAVIAMGPWSSRLAASMPLCKNFPMISGSRAHSIIVKADVPAEAMFTQYTDENGKLKEPEIYPREDGTVYICGEGDGEPLPSNPAQILPNMDACKRLHETVGKLSTPIKESPVLKNQACFLPCSPDGIPVIGPVTPYANIYIGTGHSCWGILNGPATGKCLAQQILGLPTDIDLDPFKITRF